MTEYEKLSLVLLMQIAKGIDLQQKPYSGPGADPRWMEEWKQMRDQWQKLMTNLTQQVEAALKS